MKATEIVNSDETKDMLNKSKELANKTAEHAIKTGKRVGSFVKETAKDIADDVDEIVKAEDKKKAVLKVANQTATDAVKTGKNVG